MPYDAEFCALEKRIKAMEEREREADMELRAALLRVVASIEKKHGLSKHARPLTFVLTADQEHELVDDRNTG